MGIGARHHDLAGFDRLAQGFQHRAREFGEFVQEQHAVMRQADLARFGALARRRRWPPSRRCDAVRGRAACAQMPPSSSSPDSEWIIEVSSASAGVKRRQDAGHPGGQHRLARRRASRPSAGDGARQPRFRARAWRVPGPSRRADRGAPWSRVDLARLAGRDRRLAGEVAHAPRPGWRRRSPGWRRPRPPRRPQALGHRRSRSCSAAAIAAGSAPITGTSRPSSDNSPSATVRLDLVARQDVDRGQQRQRDRQVEMRALLGQVGGREVDGDPFRRQRDRQRRRGRRAPGRAPPTPPCRAGRRPRRPACPAASAHCTSTMRASTPSNATV